MIAIVAEAMTDIDAVVSWMMVGMRRSIMLMVLARDTCMTTSTVVLACFFTFDG